MTRQCRAGRAPTRGHSTRRQQAQARRPWTRRQRGLLLVTGWRWARRDVTYARQSDARQILRCCNPPSVSPPAHWESVGQCASRCTARRSHRCIHPPAHRETDRHTSFSLICQERKKNVLLPQHRAHAAQASIGQHCTTCFWRGRRSIVGMRARSAACSLASSGKRRVAVVGESSTCQQQGNRGQVTLFQTCSIDVRRERRMCGARSSAARVRTARAGHRG